MGVFLLAMGDRQINDKELDDLREQLDRMRTDKDRLRLINTAADSFLWSTEQVKKLIGMQHYGDAQRMTAINLYPKTIDQEKFQEVIDCYKFQEDRDEICEALGL